MNGNFKKIKRCALIVRVIKACLLGGAVALPVIGLLCLLVRFEAVALGTPLIALVGGLLFLAVGALTFFLLRKSDKQIAMGLDSKHHLSEKIQTMLAYKDRQDDPMLDLQRQDADRSLESVKKTVLGLNRLWIYIICFVVGVGGCVISFFFNPVPPPVIEPEPEPEIPFAVTEMQLSALDQLIARVDASEMESPYKENVIAALAVLRSEVQEVSTVKAKDEVVTKAMDAILEQVDQSSMAVELINAMWQMGGTNTRLLVKALNYYDWPKSDEWDSFVEKMADFRVGFNHALALTETPDEQVMIEETAALYRAVQQCIQLALLNAEVAVEDPLYTVLTRLAVAKEENDDGTRVYGMSALVEYITENGYTKAQRELDATVTALNSEIFKTLWQNNVNTDTGEEAITSLAVLFDVSAPVFERPALYEDPDSEGSGGGEGGGGGGISGDVSYGSDDKVYDPFTNRYVEYGTILDKYYALMFGNINGGDYTDEEKKALEEYFKILYGGFDDENAETQE
ncbi:MAG: hypothetical protein IJY22_05005 [Clostridia bacterium]|nr:hypothetical protein [Clostridia bacterium]